MKDKEFLQKLTKKIGSVLSTVALVCSIVLCLSVVTQVLTKGYVQFGGTSLFRIVTGSMEPELPIGSLIVCQETDICEIRVDDIVCFYSLNDQILGEVVTHRVVGLSQTSQGEPLLITRGDANLSVDAEYVSGSNLIGRVNYYTKESGIMESFVNILSDKVGFMILVLVPTLLIAGFILRSCMSNIRSELERLKEEDRRQAEQKDALYTDEEYAAMLERIRDEIVEEMKHEFEEPAETGESTLKTE